MTFVVLLSLSLHVCAHINTRTHPITRQFSANTVNSVYYLASLLVCKQPGHRKVDAEDPTTWCVQDSIQEHRINKMSCHRPLSH